MDQTEDASSQVSWTIPVSASRRAGLENTPTATVRLASVAPLY
jgi:hypothetical protein